MGNTLKNMSAKKVKKGQLKISEDKQKAVS